MYKNKPFYKAYPEIKLSSMPKENLSIKNIHFLFVWQEALTLILLNENSITPGLWK